MKARFSRASGFLSGTLDQSLESARQPQQTQSMVMCRHTIFAEPRIVRIVNPGDLEKKPLFDDPPNADGQCDSMRASSIDRRFSALSD
jgi:hypothetical protein